MWRFTVSGAGPFPTGMLLVSRCWPASLVDTDVIFKERGVLVRRVDLVSPFPPERDVWREAGWEVQSCRWEP